MSSWERKRAFESERCAGVGLSGGVNAFGWLAHWLAFFVCHTLAKVSRSVRTIPKIYIYVYLLSGPLRSFLPSVSGSVK
jgi:hypothetical protein